jgi:aquaglyceroporin related protein, other eukaryote
LLTSAFRYYDQNPWYGQPKARSVYSLGKPLPHKVRFSKKQKKPKFGKPSKKSKKEEQDPEKGEVDHSEASDVQVTAPQDNSGQQAEGLEAKDHRDNEKDREAYLDTVSAARAGVQGIPGEENRKSTFGHQSLFNDGFNMTTDGSNLPSFSQGEGTLGDKWGTTRDPIGQRESDEAEVEGQNPDELRNWWARMRAKYPEPFSEFLAVCSKRLEDWDDGCTDLSNRRSCPSSSVLELRCPSI